MGSLGTARLRAPHGRPRAALRGGRPVGGSAASRATRAEKRREGVLFAAAGSASFVAAEVAPAVAHLQRIGVQSDRGSGVAYALYLEESLTPPPMH